MRLRSGETMARLRPWAVGPLVTLLAVTAVARLLGVLLPEAGIGWVDAVRGGLAAMFAVAAAAHFGRARIALVRMVPEGFPNPPLLVTATGVLEIVGTIGLIVPESARLAAICLAGLLVALFPANVQAARRAIRVAGRPTTPLWFRALAQGVLVAACLLVAVVG